jgi:hypothetical protein
VRPSSLEVTEVNNERVARENRQSTSAAHEVSAGASAGVWQGDLSSVLGGGRHRLRAQLEEARREMGRVGPIRQQAAAAVASASGDNGSWMLPAAAAARDAQQQRHQQAQRTGASATAPFADSMFWPEGQDMSYDALLALDRAAIQKGVPKVTTLRSCSRAISRLMSCPLLSQRWPESRKRELQTMMWARNAQCAWTTSKQSSGFESYRAGTFIMTPAYASGLKSTYIVLYADLIASRTSLRALEKALRLKSILSKLQLVIPKQPRTAVRSRFYFITHMILQSLRKFNTLPSTIGWAAAFATVLETTAAAAPHQLESRDPPSAAAMPVKLEMSKMSSAKYSLTSTASSAWPEDSNSQSPLRLPVPGVQNRNWGDVDGRWLSK